jgi:hypothetical protein
MFEFESADFHPLRGKGITVRDKIHKPNEWNFVNGLAL